MHKSLTLNGVMGRGSCSKNDRLLKLWQHNKHHKVYITGNFEENNVPRIFFAPNKRWNLLFIQVSREVKEDFFQLVNSYTIINGSLNMYMLYIYEPESSHGKADVEKSLFDEKDENFLEFRLQPEFLFPHSGSQSHVHTVVPQMASY